MRTILAGTERAGEKAIVAAPYAIPERLWHQLAAQGLLAGYLAEAVPSLEHCDPLVAGWWINRAEGQWFLRTPRCNVLILLSAVDETALGGAMLLEARLKDIRRIICVNGAGIVTADVDVTSRLMRLLNATRAKLETFECAFEEMGALLGDRLRLPPSDFNEKRVLLISGSLGTGGSERQVAYTACGLSRDVGYDVYVGCSHIEPPHDLFRPDVEAAGAKIVAVEEKSQEWNGPEIQSIRASLQRYEELNFTQVFHVIFHFALLIRSIRPALVHTWMDYNNVLAGLAADLVGVPALVLSGRSMAPDHFGIYQPYMRPGYRALFRRRPVIFLNNSRAGALDYAHWLDVPPENFRAVHNGFEFPEIDFAEARAAVRREHRIPLDAPVIGSIMRFTEEKRPDLFIEMARLIHHCHPQTHFIVFGAGPMLDGLRDNVNQKGLQHVIQLPGMTNQPWRSLAAMDIFVLTSRMEGLPNVLVEAQAAGCPVVTPGLGGMSETYLEGTTGLTAGGGTAAELAQGVLTLLENRSLHRDMANAAVLHARSRFGLSKMIAETLCAYCDARGRATGDYLNRKQPMAGATLLA
jgi:glycosyltransferase involved in cell wall biosynthesis